MSEAYGLLIEPFASFGFMRTALVACVALALANGPIGTLLLLRRMSLEGDVLSHAVMPGAALGFLYAGYSFAALSFGGFVTGALVAGSAGFSARLHPKRREASLAAFYLLSLAVGVMIVSVRGSNVDLMHVLFGTVLAVDMRGLLFIATISSVTLLVLAVIFVPWRSTRSIRPSCVRSAPAAAFSAASFSPPWCSTWSRVFKHLERCWRSGRCCSQLQRPCAGPRGYGRPSRSMS